MLGTNSAYAKQLDRDFDALFAKVCFSPFFSKQPFLCYNMFFFFVVHAKLVTLIHA